MTYTESLESIEYRQYIHDLNVEFYTTLFLLAVVAAAIVTVVYKLIKFIYKLWNAN